MGREKLKVLPKVTRRSRPATVWFFHWPLLRGMARRQVGQAATQAAGGGAMIQPRTGVRRTARLSRRRAIAPARGEGGRALSFSRVVVDLPPARRRRAIARPPCTTSKPSAPIRRRSTLALARFGVGLAFEHRHWLKCHGTRQREREPSIWSTCAELKHSSSQQRHSEANALAQVDRGYGRSKVMSERSTSSRLEERKRSEKQSECDAAHAERRCICCKTGAAEQSWQAVWPPSPTCPPPTSPTASTKPPTSSSTPAAPRPPSTSRRRSTTPSPLRFGYDPDAAAAIAGARFAVLRGPLARLHRALGQFMLDRNVAAGWTEVAPPVLVKPRRHVRHRPAAQVRRGRLQDRRRPLPDPDRRGVADQPRSAGRSSTATSCRCA